MKQTVIQERSLVGFQGWKVCLIVSILLLFQVFIAVIVQSAIAFNELGRGNVKPGEFAETISSTIVAGLAGFAVILPTAIVSVYLLKLLLRIFGGIRLLIQESSNHEEE